MKNQKSRWTRWQRGQALMEYWPTIPAAIMVMLMASLIVRFLDDAFMKTVTVLTPEDFVCGDEIADDVEGPTFAEMNGGCYTVELLSNSYDQVNDQTTVTYRVSSICDHDISHWVLGLPMEFEGSVTADPSELPEWVDPDPSGTGVSGLKFDKGYDSEDADKEEEDKDKPPKDEPTVEPTEEPTAEPTEEPTKKPKKDKSSLDTYGLVTFQYDAPASDLAEDSFENSRNILLTLAGHYDWGVVTIGVKASTYSFTSQIIAPVAIHDGTAEECALPEDES
ncbi:MAG: PT domain-containing protein [Anaerolineae bacterium]|nr:PT domain-containing protein [Anaerolineae bacterium]